MWMSWLFWLMPREQGSNLDIYIMGRFCMEAIKTINTFLWFIPGSLNCIELPSGRFFNLCMGG